MWDDYEKTRKNEQLGKVMIMTYSLLIVIMFITTVTLLIGYRFYMEDNIPLEGFLTLNQLLNSSMLLLFYTILLVGAIITIISIREFIIDIFINIFIIEDLISVFFTNILFSVVFFVSTIIKPNLFTLITFIWVVVSPFSIILQPAYTVTIFYKYKNITSVIGILSAFIGFISSYSDNQYLTIANILLTVLGSLLINISQPIRVIKDTNNNSTIS